MNRNAYLHSVKGFGRTYLIFIIFVLPLSTYSQPLQQDSSSISKRTIQILDRIKSFDHLKPFEKYFDSLRKSPLEENIRAESKLSLVGTYMMRTYQSGGAFNKSNLESDYIIYLITNRKHIVHISLAHKTREWLIPAGTIYYQESKQPKEVKALQKLYTDTYDFIISDFGSLYRDECLLYSRRSMGIRGYITRIDSLIFSVDMKTLDSMLSAPCLGNQIDAYAALQHLRNKGYVLPKRITGKMLALLRKKGKIMTFHTCMANYERIRYIIKLASKDLEWHQFLNS